LLETGMTGTVTTVTAGAEADVLIILAGKELAGDGGDFETGQTVV
jgi:hypothetical protein